MSKAEERALEAYPNDIFCREDVGTGRCSGVSYQTKEKRHYYQKGYEQAEKDILAIIESRVSEIIGDAQPKPILRAELKELIKRIKDDY